MHNTRKYSSFSDEMHQKSEFRNFNRTILNSTCTNCLQGFYIFANTALQHQMKYKASVKYGISAAVRQEKAPNGTKIITCHLYTRFIENAIYRQAQTDGHSLQAQHAP